MSGRTPVLGDHKRVKSKLITPFNDLLGPTRDVSWINTMIPERHRQVKPCGFAVPDWRAIADV
jgi:hypothetical protein